MLNNGGQVFATITLIIPVALIIFTVIYLIFPIAGTIFMLLCLIVGVTPVWLFGVLIYLIAFPIIFIAVCIPMWAFGIIVYGAYAPPPNRLACEPEFDVL